jgi:hypothetical protein
MQFKQRTSLSFRPTGFDRMSRRNKEVEKEEEEAETDKEARARPKSRKQIIAEL